MPFIRALIWVACLIVMVIFSVNNWVPVTIALWGDWLLDTKLPVLIVGAFLIGWLPLFIWFKASRWRMRRMMSGIQNDSGREPFNIARDPYAPPRTTSQRSSESAA